MQLTKAAGTFRRTPGAILRETRTHIIPYNDQLAVRTITNQDRNYNIITPGDEIHMGLRKRKGTQKMPSGASGLDQNTKALNSYILILSRVGKI